MVKQYTYKPGRLAKYRLLCCFFLFVVLKSFAQDGDELHSLRQQFTDYSQQIAQEKLFVHVDKSFFTAGEILWFKVYAVDAYSNKPAQLSKVAYLEVIDAEKKPVLQAKIKIVDGSGNGSFQLPATIHSGNYIVRAYTNWMKNFSPDLYFSQNITIVNTYRNLDRQQADSAQYDIRFFPEGGNLVNGIESKVAFRVIDKYGKGVNCTGSIVDQSGQHVANFKPLKFGIGSFSFTPATGNIYTAVVTIGDKTFNQPLPAVHTEGYVVHVDDAGSNINVNVASTAGSSTVYLLATTGKDVKATVGKELQNGKAAFVVSKDRLGEGITHLVVFNNQLQPVCERLYFKKPQQYLAINATPGQNEFDERKKIIVDIDAKDESNAPQTADMSMSVYRVDSLQPDDETNMAAYLLLNADLRGTIESPAYYFNSNNAESNEALDNLMLSHGWSRFNWDDIKQAKTAAFEYVPEYEGHIVTAKLTNKKSGQPADNVMAYFSAPGKSFRFAVARSKSNGIVQFNVPDFVGGDAIILQTNQMQDTNYRIDIVNPFSEKFAGIQPPAFYMPEKMQGLLLENSINTQVQNAYYSEKNRQFFAADADTVPFFGSPSGSYLLDDYTRFNTMEEVLREYVPEVAVRKHGDDFALKVYDEVTNGGFDENPLVLADGVPFFNMDTVISFNPLKIRKLDVVTKKYFLGTNIFSGVVSYTTYNGDMEGIQLDPASLVLEYEGMQLQREFYMPKYDTPKEITSRLPDFRNVLYWSPDVKTDAVTGKTQATFYTSDLPGSYAVVVHGITPTGKIGSKTVYIKVK